LPAGGPNHRRTGVYRIPVLKPSGIFSARASQARGDRIYYYGDLSEIEIAKVWDLDFDTDFDFDLDLDKTKYMRSP